MRNPRLRHLPSGNKPKSHTSRLSLIGLSNEEFKNRMMLYNEWVRSKIGEDWVVNTPLVSPARIIEEASNHPYTAAMMCQQACIILNVGHHHRVHDYLIAAYIIAGALRGNKQHISFVASRTKDGRSNSEGITDERFEKDILHYLFVYIFAQSGMVKRNRAWQWADSLHAYFEDEREPTEVEGILRLYGQNKLRIAANTAKNEKGARVRGPQADGQRSKHIDLILSEMVGEEPDVPSSAPVSEKAADFGPRGLPPCEDEPEGDTDGDDSSVPPRGGDDQGAGRQDERRESGDDMPSAEADADPVGSIDGHVVDDRLEKILLGTMSLGAKLAERDLGAEQQKRLLPLVVLLSVEIVELRRMIAGV